MSKQLARNRGSSASKMAHGRLAQVLDEIAEADAEILKASDRARSLLTEDEGRQLLEQMAIRRVESFGGWTKAELIVAIHALRSKKEAPMYMHMAHERALLRFRGQDGNGASKAAVVVLPGMGARVQQRDGVTVIDAREVPKK